MINVDDKLGVKLNLSRDENEILFKARDILNKVSSELWDASWEQGSEQALDACYKTSKTAQAIDKIIREKWEPSYD